MNNIGVPPTTNSGGTRPPRPPGVYAYESDTNTDYSKQIPKSTMKPSYSLHECEQSVDSNEHTKVLAF